MKTTQFKLWLVIGVLVLAMLACSIPGVTTSFSLTPEAEDDVSSAVVETEQPTSEPPPLPFVVPNEVLLQDTLVQLYESVSPGVVSIQVYSELGSGIGSGFVIDREGHIVTNYHVVEFAQQVEVHFQSGLKVYGEVIGEDLDSDLALIKVDVDPEDLHPLPIGDSDQLRVGQTVVAIGNPFGLSGTMTVGIVSARGRTLESIRQTDAGAFFSAGDLIQTDATINPGNSGGPLSEPQRRGDWDQPRPANRGGHTPGEHLEYRHRFCRLIQYLAPGRADFERRANLQLSLFRVIQPAFTEPGSS
jgi:S1-C subfamily serine protease